MKTDLVDDPMFAPHSKSPLRTHSQGSPDVCLHEKGAEVIPFSTAISCHGHTRLKKESNRSAPCWISVCAMLCMTIIWALPQRGSAQTVFVSGHVLDEASGRPLPAAQIINTSNFQRFLADSSGWFFIQCRKSDTLAVLVGGYAIRRWTLHDSTWKKVYEVVLMLKPLEQELPQVIVQSTRTYEQARRSKYIDPMNQNTLGMEPAELLEHPLTYLYQLLSKRERDRRAYDELMYNQRRQQLFEELIRGYQQLAILQLPSDYTSEFAEYIMHHPALTFSLTEYEFVLWLREQEQVFLRHFSKSGRQ